MSGLFWRRSLLLWLLIAFVLQGVVAVQAAFSSPGQKQSVIQAGHAYSGLAAAVDAEPLQSFDSIAHRPWVGWTDLPKPGFEPLHQS